MNKFISVILSAFSLTACENINVKDLCVDDFEVFITGDFVQLVDVRTAEEFAEGHIRGAQNIDVRAEDFMDKIQGALSTDKPVAVYCRRGRRSATAGDHLSKAGFKTVVNLKGGIQAWESAEKPTTTDKPLPMAYDESIDPMAQIDDAVREAHQEGKYVVCQVGGNWCPWCLEFTNFIQHDTAVAKIIADNYVYIHVNYSRKNETPKLRNRLGNPGRFGFPVLVVLDNEGNVIHVQDSSLLEEGEGYNSDKVLRFFRGWTPKAVRSA